MKYVITALILAVSSFSVMAEVDASKLKKKKQTPQGLYLTAKEAYEDRVNNPLGSFFIDVRTRAEVEFVGMTSMIDANIPYMVHDKEGWNAKKKKFTMEPNSNFSIAFKDALAKKGYDKNSKIIVMCRSGSRSAKAANLLNQLGYKNVYSVVDGFEGDKAKAGAQKGQRVVNGWKNTGLPWSYKLAEAKMYFEE